MTEESGSTLRFHAIHVTPLVVNRCSATGADVAERELSAPECTPLCSSPTAFDSTCNSHARGHGTIYSIRYMFTYRNPMKKKQNDTPRLDD